VNKNFFFWRYAVYMIMPFLAPVLYEEVIHSIQSKYKLLVGWALHARELRAPVFLGSITSKITLNPLAGNS